MVVGTLTPLSNRLSRAAPMKDVISTSKVDHPSSLLYTCILVIFIDDTPPNLLLSQAMANRILGCLPTFHIPWRSVYFKIKLLTDKSGQNM